jgi:hypothetical protein
VTTRAWPFEEAGKCVRELDAKLSPIGYHVMMCGPARKTPELELYVYPPVKTEDVEGVLQTTGEVFGWRLRARAKLHKPKTAAGMTFERAAKFEEKKGLAKRHIIVYA